MTSALIEIWQLVIQQALYAWCSRMYYVNCTQITSKQIGLNKYFEEYLLQIITSMGEFIIFLGAANFSECLLLASMFVIS